MNTIPCCFSSCYMCAPAPCHDWPCTTTLISLVLQADYMNAELPISEFQWLQSQLRKHRGVLPLHLPYGIAISSLSDGRSCEGACVQYMCHPAGYTHSSVPQPTLHLPHSCTQHIQACKHTWKEAQVCYTDSQNSCKHRLTNTSHTIWSQGLPIWTIADNLTRLHRTSMGTFITICWSCISGQSV